MIMSTTINEEKQRRFYFNWIPEFFIRPKSTILKIISQSGNVWLTPILILSVSAILRAYKGMVETSGSIDG
jgi:hypothetical protein